MYSSSLFLTWQYFLSLLQYAVHSLWQAFILKLTVHVGKALNADTERDSNACMARNTLPPGGKTYLNHHLTSVIAVSLLQLHARRKNGRKQSGS
jgi:hypothetical protein